MKKLTTNINQLIQWIGATQTCWTAYQALWSFIESMEAGAVLSGKALT